MPATRDDLEPVQLAGGTPYTLHVMRDTAVSITDAQNELRWAPERSGADTYKFKRLWFETVVDLLNRDQAGTEPLPWFDGKPLDANSLQGEVLTVQVRPECIKPVRKRIIRAASWQGLTVYDPHAQQIFLPSGAFFVDGSVYSPWKGKLEYPVAQASKILRKTLLPFFRKLGFKQASRPPVGLLELERTFQGVVHKFLIFVDKLYPGSMISCRVDIQITSDIARRDGVVWPERADGKALWISIAQPLHQFFPSGDRLANELEYQPARGEVRVYSDAHVELAGMLLANRFVDHVLPILAHCDTAAGLNREVNATLPALVNTGASPFHSAHWHTYHLLLAHLADDPRFEEMCAAILERYSDKLESDDDQHTLPTRDFKAIVEARRLSR
nr:hypothetical protein [Rhodoferax sp.]